MPAAKPANKPVNRVRTTTHRAAIDARLGPDGSSPATTMEGAIVRALKMVGGSAGGKGKPHEPRLKPHRSQLATPKPVASDIVRFRPKGAIDRRIKVEYIADPAHSKSVLLRLTPATSTELPATATAENLLSSQQAADLLNVSRPYLTKLADQGAFHGVVRTAAGHRRIPRTEVERVLAEMRDSRRSALDEMDQSTQALRRRELEAARAKAKRRWGPSQSE